MSQIAQKVYNLENAQVKFRIIFSLESSTQAFEEYLSKVEDEDVKKDLSLHQEAGLLLGARVSWGLYLADDLTDCILEDKSAGVLITDEAQAEEKLANFCEEDLGQGVVYQQVGRIATDFLNQLIGLN